LGGVPVGVLAGVPAGVEEASGEGSGGASQDPVPRSHPPWPSRATILETMSSTGVNTSAHWAQTQHDAGDVATPPTEHGAPLAQNNSVPQFFC
jgi:hypothetical protein